MQRLSSPLESMKSHYTVIVVGSGYGGGIAASRMARAGRDVCVLERGRELIPGEYPDTEVEALREFQVDLPDNRVGRRTGLYDFRVNSDINVLVGCGLGGTSLINANVTLEPEPRVFQDPVWPRALRDDIDLELKQGFERARQMLAAAPYPDDAPNLSKHAALKQSAEAMGTCRFGRPPINVTFEAHTNKSGVHQEACTQCGDCVSGCNVSAKNTVLMNYLPDAVRHGAEIYTHVGVRRVAKDSGRWVVYFEHLEAGREVFNAPTQFVTADHLFLSAGSLGSTEILLRSKQEGLSLSNQLGRHFTGNGDVLGFAYNCDIPISGIGRGDRSDLEDVPVGPSITGIIDCREREFLDNGWILEEGALPGAMAKLIPHVFKLAAKAVGRDTDSGFKDAVREGIRELTSLIRGAYHGAAYNTQTFLVMAHDSADGKLVLENDRIRVHWPGVGQQEVFKKVNAMLYEATRSLGGTYVPNPLWHDLLEHQLITVHPLGGCRMAESAQSGVVDHSGRVFASSSGEEIHDGLYVLDGAIIPRSVGINPLATISALAERGCSLIARAQGWQIDYSETTPVSAPVVTRKPGIRFTERMAGFFSLGDFDDFHMAAQKGREQNATFEFTLTIVSMDLETMLSGPQHQAVMSGTVRAAALSPDPLTVTNGEFQLFVEDPQQPETRQMRYRMKMSDTSGRRYDFEGFKVVKDDPGFDLWPDTTTLYISISETVSGGRREIGKGILKISPTDFARQMTTMEVLNVDSATERLKLLYKFGNFFGGTLFDIYGGIFARPQEFDPNAPPRKKRALRVSAPEVHWAETTDKVLLRLTRYKGGTKGPVILSHGLGVSSCIFTIDTIDTNLLEYLFLHEYDVWLLDYRSSIELASAERPHTADDVAKFDYPAAVAKVREIAGVDSVQMVVHCFGATTFFMAMLAGLQGVRSAVCSQIATHVKAPLMTRIKSGLYMPTVLKVLGVDSLTAYVDKHADWQDRLFNTSLRLQPMEVEELCRSPVCHRITFLYGNLYEHDQLNTATHDALHEMFGVAHIEALEHLALLVRKGHVVDARSKDVYLPHLERLAIPISFIHGAENACYHPDSTEITYKTLREKNGDLYTRHVISRYGHIDCIFGKNAVTDVYPLIVSHLEKTASPLESENENT